MPAMEQCHQRHAWAISWKGREALRTRVASLLGPQVKDRGVPYRWREQRCAARQNGAAHVSEGSKGDVRLRNRDVFFTPMSGH
jgi:hypothetical protein